MRLIFVIFVCFEAIYAIERLSSDDEEKIFSNYLRKFNVRVGRVSTYVDKMKDNVLKRYYEVESHNELFKEGKLPFEEELNKFSYLSVEELKATSLGFRGNETSSYSSKGIKVPILSSQRKERTNLPTYWNWKDKGIVQPVQNQGGCNSCYAFAALGAIEAAACKKHGQCAKFSEQEAMECTALCDGGWDDWIYTYSISNNGCTSSSYPYYGYKLYECSAARSRRRLSNTKVSGWHTLPNDAETIKNYLYEWGPMFVSFYVYENFFSYKSGIYTSTEGSEIMGGHAVLLTGWGTENGIDYWIMRNSWGAEFGERGYFRIQRGTNLCNIEGWKVTIPIIT